MSLLKLKQKTSCTCWKVVKTQESCVSCFEHNEAGGYTEGNNLK